MAISEFSAFDGMDGLDYSLGLIDRYPEHSWRRGCLIVHIRAPLVMLHILFDSRS